MCTSISHMARSLKNSGFYKSIFTLIAIDSNKNMCYFKLNTINGCDEDGCGVLFAESRYQVKAGIRTTQMLITSELGLEHYMYPKGSIQS